MPGDTWMRDAEKTILRTVNELFERRGEGTLEVTRASRLFEDLDLDSLEVAELSAALEDELGRDPFSEGMIPPTVGELVAFYDA